MRQPLGEHAVTENFVEILVLAVLPALVSGAVILVTRAVIDARTRRKLIDARLPADVVHAFAASDQAARILSALKWGLIGFSVGVGLLILQLLPGPQAIGTELGVVLVAGSIGLLLFHRLAPRPARPDALYLPNGAPPGGAADLITQ
jgi:hypothetical protein